MFGGRRPLHWPILAVSAISAPNRTQMSAKTEFGVFWGKLSSVNEKCVRVVPRRREESWKCVIFLNGHQNTLFPGSDVLQTE
jgi:hypothetical protein